MMEMRRRTMQGPGIHELGRRQVGELSPRSFTYRVRASEALVLRLALNKKLEKHGGCVNTVNFNAAGDILVSGSDDRMIILWNWDARIVKLAFHSGHVNNVFQAKLMPYSNDRSIVTCAADGQVRHAQIQESGRVDTENLGKHQGRVHKLAIEPGSPHTFYSCGEDGLVQHFDLRTRTAMELFTCNSFPPKSGFTQAVHLNAIAINPRDPNLFAIGGSDEYARLYDIRKYKLDGSTNHDHPIDFFCPHHLIGDDHVGITGLAFSDENELLVSYNKESIYLFSMDLGWGPNPLLTSKSWSGSAPGAGSDRVSGSPSNPGAGARPGPQVYKGHRNRDTVKGVSFFGPNCKYVASGSDCGSIFIWRKKGGELLRVMDADQNIVNCIEPHPHATVLASSGIENNIKIWSPTATEPASLPVEIKEMELRTRKRPTCFASEQDVITQILPLLRRRRLISRSPRRGRLSDEAALFEYIMAMVSDDSTDTSENTGD